MNTAPIKSFSRISRINLCEAVANQLKYWGFDEKQNIHAQPVSAAGGYAFRGDVYDDVTVVPKWESLRQKVMASKEGFKDVTEEAAYTWFNRLMAIKILEENHFIDPVLQYQEGSSVPMILQNAKAGNHQVTHSVLLRNLQEAIFANQDEAAFRILIINYCDKNPLLKKVFGRIHDYTEILFPQNLLSANGFLALLNDESNIAKADYREVELIGWLYQFYIADKKDEVFAGFKKNKKARAEDIPAATQIFTPKWIVSYMVENTMGKIYLDYEPDSALREQMKYLVQNDTDTAPLIEDITQLSLIDPACGSGHILVTGLEWLFPMYREQGYTAKAAIENILKNNLFGLDLDDRAMQLARFAVLLKAAQQLEKTTAGDGRKFLANPEMPLPHIYAFPESKDFSTEELAQFTENQHVAEIFAAVTQLKQGKNLGSALKLNLSEEARTVLATQHQIWNEKAEKGTLDIAETAIWEHLKTYVEVALVLTKKYTSVVANPPYMGQKSMNGELKDFVTRHYPLTKTDLFAVFMEVCLGLNLEKGLMGMINQHSWMFLSSYEKYREFLLLNYGIQNMLHLGPRTFEELSGEVVQSTCFILENERPVNAKANYYRLVDYKSNKEKEQNFLANNNFYPNIPQTNFDKIPGSPIAYWVSDKIVESFEFNDSFLQYGKGVKGLDTGKDEYYLKFWWEPNILRTIIYDSENWTQYQKGGSFKKWYGNKEYFVKWENNGFEIKNFSGAYARNQDLYFTTGIEWSRISSSRIGLRLMDNSIFGGGSQAAFLKNQNLNSYFLGLLNSDVAYNFLKMLNPTLVYQGGDINRIPVIISENSLKFVNQNVNKNISLSKTDWDSRETSWDFAQNPLLAQNQESLPKAFASWQEQVTKDFFQLHQNEEELNRIFIDIYGLQAELTPEVALKDITILQDELKADDLAALEENFRKNGKENTVLPLQKEVVVSQLLSYFVGVLLGRYRLDQAGLHIAHPNATDQELADYQVENAAIPFTMKIDDDAILPLMGSKCAFPDDAVRRIEDLVYHIWGEKSQQENMNFINQSLGMPMEKWLTEKFWDYHISGKMYKKKPIYWLFCSNPKKPQQSAFRVLVYMHRMDAFTVQKVMRQYLHPQQEYLRSKYEEMKEREVSLSTAEAREFANLPKLQHELKEYNEQLKKIADLQLTFDLDDGVSVNYQKFEGIVAVI